MFGGLACLALLLVFPLLFPNPAVTSVAVFALIAAGAATAWNIFSGYTGYISLGYAAFYGLGAYALAILCAVWHVPGGFGPFLLLPVVGGITGLCAIPLGWVALKTKRFAFMVITIAIYAVTSQLPNLLTGLSAHMGELSLPIPLWSGDTFNLPFYYTALAVLLLALGTSWWVRTSKYGLGLLAMRDDEERAWGLGIDTRPYKLTAFVISAIFAGMTGAINAYFLGFISPTSAFDRAFNIATPLMAFLGGIGTLVGPVLGALLAVPLQQYLTIQFGVQGWDLILYGVLFLLILQLLPQGILPALQKRWTGRVSTGEGEKEKAYKLSPQEFGIQSIVPARSSVATIPLAPVTPIAAVLPVIPATNAPISRGKMTQGTFEERLMAIIQPPVPAVPELETADAGDDTQKHPAIAARHARYGEHTAIAAPVVPSTPSIPATPPPVYAIPEAAISLHLPATPLPTQPALSQPANSGTVNAAGIQQSQLRIQKLPEQSTKSRAIPYTHEESLLNTAMTQKMRATRLVSLSAKHSQQAAAHSPNTPMQHQHPTSPASPTRQPRPPAPRCPHCQEVLSAWDATYFCTHCGLTLPPPQRPQPVPKRNDGR